MRPDPRSPEDDDDDIEDENAAEVINSMSLNCGESPNLTDLDMNRISDNVNYICNDLLFIEILREENNDAKELLDKHAQALKDGQSINSTEKDKIDQLLFPKVDTPMFIKKRQDFAMSLEDLSEKLDSINTKKDSFKVFQSTVYAVLVVYGVIYLYFAYWYIKSFASDDIAKRSSAEQYNIGFVTNIAYFYLLVTLSESFFAYSKLSVTMGDLDTSVCGGLSDLVESLKIIFRDCKADKSKSECRDKVLRELYKIYYLKYIRNIFIAAKSEFKQTVNSINKFVAKQKKFLMKEDNIDSTFTNDNAAFEEFYNILLHNHGIKLFKSTKSPIERRDSLSSRYSRTDQYTAYERFLKEEFLIPYIRFLVDLESDNPNTDTSKLKSFLVTLDRINENNLPEYKECLELIFPVEMEKYSDFTVESYLRFIRDYLKDDLEAKLLYNPNVDDYFRAVREYHIQNGILIFTGEDTTPGNLDGDETLAVMFTRIQQRRSNSSTIITKYREFQNVARTRIIVEDDIKDVKLYKEVFETIRQHFIELTSEYKLNENIIMRFMTANLREDEAFEDDPGKRSLVLSNIKFIVSRISVSLAGAQNFKTNMLEGTGINMNKYISFLKFENKIQQLDDEDLDRLNKYVQQTNETIRRFRKYVKSEEIMFSKKFQMMSIYEDIWRDTAIGSGILLMVKITDMFGLVNPQRIEQMIRSSETGEKVLNSVGKGVKNVKSKLSKSTNAAKGSPSNSTGTSMFTANTTLPARTTNTQGGDGKKDNIEKNKETAKEKANETAKEKAKEKAKEEAEEDTLQTLVKVTGMIVLWAIFFTFVKSYLMKHKADLNYDKVVNVLNTTKFEYEFGKLSRYFNEYRSSKSSRKCKKMYHSLIMVIEIYAKCNFIKNSMKRTPFPVTEMWTNAVVMVVFLSVI